VADQAQELNLEREFTASILESQPAPVLVIDDAGRVVRCNGACSAVWGSDFSVFLGSRDWLDVVPAAERPALEEVLQRLRGGETSIDFQSHWNCVDGEQRLISWSTAGFAEPGGGVPYFILTGIDITEQRQAELSVRRSLEASAQMQRQQIAGELAAYLAHELNQPLGSIGLFAETAERFIKTPGSDGARLIPTLEQISDQAHRAAEIVRRLRTFLQRGSLEPELVDVDDVIEAACGLFRQKASERGVELRCERHGGLPTASGVALHLEQVLANLLNNALEAIADSESHSGCVAVRTALHDGVIRITVTDTGPGVDPVDEERLFRGFETSKRHGLGMGLRISRSLVEAMGGRLWVEPQRPGGVFHCEVPIATS
jgi:two-component system CheB/CheR fusion protein